MKSLTVLIVGLMAASAQAHGGHRVIVPPVPAGIEVSADNKAFLVGHAYGTQNYICLPSGASFAWSLFPFTSCYTNGLSRAESWCC